MGGSGEMDGVEEMVMVAIDVAVFGGVVAL